MTFQIPFKQFQVILRGELDILIRACSEVQRLPQLYHHRVRIRRTVDTDLFRKSTVVGTVQQVETIGLRRRDPP